VIVKMTQTNAAKYEDVDHVSGTQTLKSSDWDDDRQLSCPIMVTESGTESMKK